MPFKKGFWIEEDTNIAPKYKDRVSVTKNDVTLHWLQSKSVKDTYKVEYTLTIVPDALVEPKDQLKGNEVTKTSLKNAIIANINPYDRDYMKLHDYSTNKATFYFDYKKWFKDALRGVIPKTHFSTYQRIVDFKKRIPRMIATQMTADYFSQFMERRFKEYIIKKHLVRTWLEKILPRNFSRSIRAKIENIFDYDYDIQNNRMLINIKTPYLLGIMYALGQVGKKVKNPKFKANNHYGADFSKSVKRNISNFKDMKTPGFNSSLKPSWISKYMKH